MKIAILSDIHGNAHVLRAVFKEVDKEDVQVIYCLGDQIGIGHETNEVLDLLFSRLNVNVIKGNHEDAILSIVHNQPYPGPKKYYDHHMWIADRLNPEWVDKLTKLPRTLTLQVGDKQVLFVHYHLDEEHNYQRINRNPSKDELDQLYDGTPYSFVFFGHHHSDYLIRGKQCIYVNPGSLGCNNEPLARYVFLNLPEWMIELGRVIYDRTNFLSSFQTSDIPNQQDILKRKFGM